MRGKGRRPRPPGIGLLSLDARAEMLEQVITFLESLCGRNAHLQPIRLSGGGKCGWLPDKILAMLALWINDTLGRPRVEPRITSVLSASNGVAAAGHAQPCTLFAALRKEDILLGRLLRA